MQQPYWVSFSFIFIQLLKFFYQILYARALTPIWLVTILKLKQQKPSRRLLLVEIEN